MDRSILQHPPGPPPMWWLAWHPPLIEREGAAWPAPTVAAQALLWRAIAADAEARGDLAEAARALRQADVWEFLMGRFDH